MYKIKIVLHVQKDLQIEYMHKLISFEFILKSENKRLFKIKTVCAL